MYDGGVLRTGDALDGRYEVGRALSRGDTSEVWSAKDVTSAQEVAIKVPRVDARKAEVIARLEQEGDVMARLKSPFISSCLRVGRMPDGAPYLVFERLYGQTLGDRMRKERFLSMEDAAWIVDDILEALVCADGSGVVHRDLNPSNVFLEETRSGRLRTKVLGFGLAKVRAVDAPASKPATGGLSTVGEIAYAAPEQLGEAGTVSGRADLYSLGTILFRMLAGRLPFGDVVGPALVTLKREQETPSIDDVTGEKWPVAVSGFLRRTLARAPLKRYPTAEATLLGWRAACATLSGMTPPYDPSGRRDTDSGPETPRKR